MLILAAIAFSKRTPRCFQRGVLFYFGLSDLRTTLRLPFLLELLSLLRRSFVRNLRSHQGPLSPRRMLVHRIRNLAMHRSRRRTKRRSKRLGKLVSSICTER
ncbi:hypothetical protein RB6849 [Rhodopirellula baltica SH 1]|uniref:Uncharacterized protein n=1 Tax=Rhodopirellula baltica (strain DSM 10527 / NCIMB 13988 / SH1) TaxID=243090 RepID=Q7UPM0_RHOBA|nr:hypothetical protein RB6849 [Rhodopirellula baltica SH 1]